MSRQAVIVESAMSTGYGSGIEVCWRELMAARSVIARDSRFTDYRWQSDLAALVPDCCLADGQRSRLTAMLEPVLSSLAPVIPGDAALLLATAIGEVELLEQQVLNQGSDPEAGSPMNLLTWLRQRTGVKGEAALVSAACASSTAALVQARDMIEDGRSEAVLVIACDAVSEFTFSGFSSLMALSSDRDRPYDVRRNGLNLGEGAAVVLLMQRSRADSEKRSILAAVAGCGMASDANHMTGPCRAGNGLAKAVDKALGEADIEARDIDFICGHGTGTVYNDAMELQAFKQLFPDRLPLLFSIKGGIGHTLGAAGLLEALVTVRGLRERLVPPTVGTEQPMPDGDGQICLRPRGLRQAEFALSTNSGFGGLNAAVVLRRCA